MPFDFHDQLLAELPQLRSYALMMTRNQSAADDLLQETACRAISAKRQFTPGTNFKAWLYRILRNEFISTCRRAKRTPSSIAAVPEAFLARDGDQEAKLLTKEVLNAMDSLQVLQREVLMLYCAGGMNYEEIAAALGCSVGTVKSRMWRARHSMRAVLLGDEAAAMPEMQRDEVRSDDRAPRPPRAQRRTNVAA